MRSTALAIFALIAFSGVVSAQNTSPNPSTFEIVTFNSGNVKGTLLSTATLENTRMDTLPPINMTVSVQTADSASLVLQYSYSIGNGSKISNTHTAPVWDQWFFPRDAANDFPPNGDNLPDSLFSVVLSNRLPVAGEQFRITVKKESKPLVTPSRLTIMAAWADTITDGALADTLWSDALVWSDDITVYVKGTGSYDTDCVGCFVYQTKIAYEDGEWAGLGAPNNRAIVIDTLTFLTTQTKAFKILNWDGTAPVMGDSIRVGIIATAATIDWYVNWMKALWRAPK